MILRMILNSRKWIGLLLAFSTIAPSAGAAVSPDCSQAAQGSDIPIIGAVRGIARSIYEPFSHSDYGPEGTCIDPRPLQILVDLLVKRTDGYSPTLQSFCLKRPRDGELSIEWSLGPTPEAELMIRAGRNEDEVDSLDFWKVQAPQGLSSFGPIDLKGLILEREGRFDVQMSPVGATAGSKDVSIAIRGISVDAAIPGAPSILTHDMGIDGLYVTEDARGHGDFTAKLDAPFFNIPVTVSADDCNGAPGSYTVDVLGMHFQVNPGARN